MILSLEWFVLRYRIGSPFLSFWRCYCVTICLTRRFISIEFIRLSFHSFCSHYRNWIHERKPWYAGSIHWLIVYCNHFRRLVYFFKCNIHTLPTTYRVYESRLSLSGWVLTRTAKRGTQFCFRDSHASLLVSSRSPQTKMSHFCCLNACTHSDACM